MHNDESHPQQPSQAAGEEVTDEELSHLYFNHDNPDAEHVSISFGRAVLELAAARPPAPPEGARVPADVMEFITEISKQKPEKPDYWSECGQCSRNTSNAEDLLERIAASPEAAEAGGWLPWDSKNPPEGTYWLRMETPDVDCDVDDDGRMVGRYTDETCVEYAVATVSIGPDGETELDAVQRWDLGEIPELCWVTHYAEVKRPEFLHSPPPADEETGK